MMMPTSPITRRIRGTGGAALVVAVIAVGLVGIFTAWRVSATSGPSASMVVSVTPQRIIDTRAGVDVGLSGPFVSAVPRQLKVTGEIATTTGVMTVVPQGASGVMLNVTVVEPEARGFVSVRPADAPGAPTTSSLNLEAGAILANAVQVNLPSWQAGDAEGAIEITYDAYGTPGPSTDILVDVVGYTVVPAARAMAAHVLETSNAFPIGPGEAFTELFECGADWIATAGGYEISEDDLIIEDSRPAPSANAWMITARNENPTASRSYNVWVLCLRG
jgi:hypothetical protein